MDQIKELEHYLLMYELFYYSHSRSTQKDSIRKKILEVYRKLEKRNIHVCYMEGAMYDIVDARAKIKSRVRQINSIVNILNNSKKIYDNVLFPNDIAESMRKLHMKEIIDSILEWKYTYGIPMIQREDGAYIIDMTEIIAAYERNIVHVDKQYLSRLSI